MQTTAAANTIEQQATDADVIAQYVSRVRGLASKYSNGSNTDDLAQEGLIALLRARTTWRAESAFWTYAKQVVRTAMVRYATEEASERSDIGDDRIEEIESCERSADDLLEVAEGVAKLSNLMIHLSEMERKIVRQHIVDGDSLAAVARGLEWSNDKTERIYRGAIDTLRERMQAQL